MTMTLPADHAGPRARSATLDAVRATALIGVLVVNLLTISGLRLLDAPSLALVQTPIDRAADLLVAILVEGKALAAFSMLFGLSFCLLMEGTARRGSPFLPYFSRRLLVLAGLGILNAAAFYWGDILTTYAVIGAFLPLAALLPQRIILVLAGLLLILPPLLLALAGVAPPAPDPERMASLRAFASPDPFATIAQNWALFTGAVGEANGLRIWRYTQIGGLFLLGLHAGRSGLLAAVERGALLRPALLALATGLLCESLRVLGLVTGPAATATLVGKPLMAVGYVILIGHLLARPGGAAMRAALAPLGRMALTGYLMGGLLGQAVFYGWGLGLVGRTGTLAVLLWALAIVVLLGLFARFWLARFAFGPWEWLWRRLSRREG